MLAVFIALLQQQLHPQADAQQGLFPGLFFDYRHKARGGEFLHGVAKGSHAGQDDPVRRPEPGGGVGEDQL